jgi:hypothetical protein
MRECPPLVEGFYTLAIKIHVNTSKFVQYKVPEKIGPHNMTGCPKLM